MEIQYKLHYGPVWEDKTDFIVQALIDDADEPTSEQLWTKQVADYQFMLCCIPFFLYKVSLGDIVETDTSHWVTRVVTRSGRRTYRVWLRESSLPHAEIFEALTGFGALLEWASESHLAVDAENEAIAERVFAYLEDKMSTGLIFEDADSEE